jgi:uncharacterized protein (DUF2062 family)
MTRKRFRKLLPNPESIERNRYLAFFGSTLKHPNLWHLNRRSVAGGVAVGMFCGLVPGPLQMLTAALFAVILRVNLPVAVVCTWYTNPFTIVPLYYLAYKLGRYVTGGEADGVPAPELDFELSNIGSWLSMLFDWMAAMGKPFLLGLLLLATILAVVGYFAALAAWRLSVAAAWRKRARRRRALPDG